MTKEEEVKIVAKLVEKYPELEKFKVKDGLFRKGSNKKVLTIITDEEDIKLFHKCIKMTEERRKQKGTPTKKSTPKKPTPKKSTPSPPVKKETPSSPVKKETPKPPVKKETPKPPVKEEPPIEKVLSESKPEITPKDIRELTDESSELSVHEVTDNLDFCKIDLPKKKIYYLCDYDKQNYYIFCRGLPKGVKKNIETRKKTFEGMDDNDYQTCFKIYYECTNDKVYSKVRVDNFFEENITDVVINKIPIESNIFVCDDFINNDDTNKIFFNKIVTVLNNNRGKNKQLLTSKEIFAWFNDKDNIKPIGFDYENNKLDMKDEKLILFLDKDCSNSDIIDINALDMPALSCVRCIKD